MSTHGWMGRVLRVDLATGRITKEELSQQKAKDFIGCRGLNAAYLYDEVGPEVDPFDAGNKLIFGTGPLEGTPIGMSRLGILTKHPNRFLGEGSAGGHWAAELKFAGYDILIVENKAARPVWLLVIDDKVEIHDAAHLWGRNTREKSAIIRQDTGVEGIQVASVGMAGENKVFGAKIQFTVDHSGGKGCGTIMGDKNLAAVAVKGSGMVTVADGEGFLKAYRDFRHTFDLATTRDAFVPSWSFNSANMLLELFNENGWVHAYNAQRGLFEPGLNDVDYLDKYIVRPESGYCCPFPACGRRYEIKEGPFAGTAGDEREVGYAQSAPILGIRSYPHIIRFREMAAEAGLDEDHIMYTIAWAMECYERGIINRTDTDGIELRFGNADGFITMIDKITRREGFGDLLAEGVAEAARRVGKGSERFALCIKGKELERMPQRNGYQMALGLAVSEGGPDHTRWYPPYPPNPKTIPTDIDLPFDPYKAFQTRNPEDKGRLVRWLYDSRAIVESLPSCVYMIRGTLSVDFRPWLALYNACTGEGCNLEEFIRKGTRIVNLERSYIVREGFRRKDDTIPRRMLEEPVKDHNIPPVGKNLDIMLDDYYEVRGWDKATAIPKEETLRGLGLDYVAEDFQRRGIWSEQEEGGDA